MRKHFAWAALPPIARMFLTDPAELFIPVLPTD
jgi:hypothetical protein